SGGQTTRSISAIATAICSPTSNNGRGMYLLYSATSHDDWIGPLYKLNQTKMTLTLG
ncbi:MAG: hypothetical protein ACI906_004627, partial [Candidatus Latescibacterota bacterium]